MAKRGDAANKYAYGGQAVIEGVMMKGRSTVALAVRTADGTVVVETDTIRPLRFDDRLMRVPVLRGALALADSLLVGVKAIFRSAEIGSPRKDTGIDWNRETQARSLWWLPLAGLAVAASVMLFVVIPAAIASVVAGVVPLPGKIGLNLVESVVRMFVLVGYVTLISRMREIQRVLEYHGAEHKVVWAWETLGQDAGGLPEGEHEMALLLARRARSMSTIHPRCGTSFLFLTVLVSVVLFSLVSPDRLLLRIAFRTGLLPLVAGIAYELLRASRARSGPVLRILGKPGLILQRLTTREPDEDQIEVASLALARLVVLEEGP